MEVSYEPDPSEVARDVALVEAVGWAKKVFFDRLCEASLSVEQSLIETIRLETTYDFCRFYFLIWAQNFEADEDIVRLAEAHNDYIGELLKSKARMEAMGLREDRLLQAIFTSDTLPRLRQTWRDEPGTIDQSNLARLLVLTMSTEQTRKIVLACEAAGFLNRRKTPFGTMVVSSTGIMERIFGSHVRDLRAEISRVELGVGVEEHNDAA